MPGSKSTTGSQLDLPIEREHYADRHWDKGGRSFYFFDFDDNVMRLATPIYVFERDTGAELALSTAEFAAASPQLGKPGPWERYEIQTNDAIGSFRRFRDTDTDADTETVTDTDTTADTAAGTVTETDATPATPHQPFIEDINTALAGPKNEWLGPSWDLFFHAVHNQRPLAIITARGHHPTTVARGIAQLHNAGHLTALPSYLAIIPVSHRETRARLGDPNRQRSIPELKKIAIVRLVEMAMERHGKNPHHRFGMSEDAPDNLALVSEAMRLLKERHPDNAFFVIDSSQTPIIKTEIQDGDDTSEAIEDFSQLELF